MSAAPDNNEVLMPDEALRRRNLETYERIYHVTLSTDPAELERYRMIRARNGALVLCHRIVRDGRSVWQPWNSLYDPAYEASRWAESIEQENRRTTLAILCFRMGYELSALVQRFRPDTQFYIYEPDEVQLVFVFGFLDLTELLNDPRVMLITPSFPDGGFRDVLERVTVHGSSYALAVPLPEAPEDETFYDACAKIIITTVFASNNQMASGRKSFRQRMAGWMRLHRNSALHLMMERLPRELPVIVVAAGPSLMCNVSQLKEIANRALIVCTDRAAATLVRQGIRPHLLITVDTIKSPVYLKHEELADVPLMAAFQTNPATQNYADGRMIYINALDTENRLPGLAGRVILQYDLGGNVATAAFTSFAQMGFRHVILIGQDLAMLGGAHHADDRTEGLFEAGEVIEIEGIDGGMVQSHVDWVHFRDNYEAMIQRFPGTECIDATEGGALIHGSTVMTLQEAIAVYCTETWDIPAMLTDLPTAQTETEHRETVELLQRWVTDLDRFIGTGEKILELLGQLLRIARYQDISDRKYARKLAQLDELRAGIIDHELANILRNHWIQDRYTIPDRTYMLRNNDEAIPVLEHAITFYKQLPENCHTLQDAIQAVLNDAAG
ncbi:MAG: motility associated factor glycosyltransferase family protein [Butyrivibrio sp.]|nr:motility associated factor glycosyltransferase family protein [Butyrivibrio sp.]